MKIKPEYKFLIVSSAHLDELNDNIVNVLFGDDAACGTARDLLGNVVGFKGAVVFKFKFDI